MSVVHIGTEVTLATIPVASISNNDIAYIWLNSWVRKMVFDATSTKAEDIVNHPYYVRPDDYSTGGVWIEEVGADDPQAFNGSSLATGIVKSVNWSATEGSEIDLDNGTIKLGGSSSPAFSVATDGVLTATGAVITGNISATTGSIGGWIVTADYIKDIAGAVGLSSLVTGGDDVRFWAGHATPGSAPFRVTEAGALVVTSATVTGAITISSGSGIANFSDAGALATEDAADFSTQVDGAAKPADNATVGATWGTNLNSIPTTLSAPSGDGLYLSSTYLGFYKDAAWTSYIDDAGNMILGDIAGGNAGLAWAQAAGTFTVKGIVTATSGAIGGFTLNASHLYTGSKAAYNDANAGVHLGTDGIGFGNNVFTVSSAGALVATSATITGAITATSGSFIGAITGSTIDIGGADATSFHVDVNGNLWSGAATYNIATNPFAVSNAGLLRAVSGSVGGFTLDATAGLYAGTGATRVQMKPGAAGVGGIWTGATAVADAKNYLDVDGSGHLADGNISWTAAGVLTQSVDDGGAITIVQGADLTLEGGVSGDPSVIHLISGTSANAVAEIRFEYIDEIASYHSIGMTTFLESGYIPHCTLAIGPSDAAIDDGASDLASVVVGGSWDGNTADYVRLVATTQVYFSGPVYATGNVSADSFTDRTPEYRGDAISDIKRIKGNKGKIDHKTLPEFARKTVFNHNADLNTGKLEITEEDGRDIGAMVSVLTVAVQQIADRLEKLEKGK